MKVTRKDWESLQSRVRALEADLRIAERNALMPVKTGEVLTSVVVPMILAHMKVEVRHGYRWLLPESETDGR